LVKRKLFCLVSIVSVCSLLTGCSIKQNNIVGGKDGDYFYNSVEYAKENIIDYEGFFLKDGIMLPLNLEEDSVSDLAKEWNWQLDVETVIGEPIEVSEEDALNYWKNTDGSDIEVNGSFVKLSDIVKMHTKLVQGQGITITPSYEAIEETKEDTKEKDTQEELEDSHPLKEIISSIKMYNLGKDPTTIKNSLENYGYFIELNDYRSAFSFESDISDKDFLSSLVKLLGNPTKIWSERLSDEEYTDGKRVEIVVFEFPNFSYEVSITEKNNNNLSISSVRYYSKNLWSTVSGYYNENYIIEEGNYEE